MAQEKLNWKGRYGSTGRLNEGKGRKGKGKGKDRDRDRDRKRKQ